MLFHIKFLTAFRSQESANFSFFPITQWPSNCCIIHPLATPISAGKVLLLKNGQSHPLANHRSGAQSHCRLPWVRMRNRASSCLLVLHVPVLDAPWRGSFSFASLMSKPVHNSGEPTMIYFPDKTNAHYGSTTPNHRSTCQFFNASLSAPGLNFSVRAAGKIASPGMIS